MYTRGDKSTDKLRDSYIVNPFRVLLTSQEKAIARWKGKGRKKGTFTIKKTEANVDTEASKGKSGGRMKREGEHARVSDKRAWEEVDSGKRFTSEMEEEEKGQRGRGAGVQGWGVTVCALWLL